jgi:2-iminobutanoate/2-iminopropanoate deaminase
MTAHVVSPDTVHKPTTYYSHAMVTKGMVYTAGQAPHDLHGKVLPPSDSRMQIRQVFENMRAVLTASYSSFDNVVQIRIFLRERDILHEFWQIAREYFHDNHPAVTISVVDGLAGSDYLLEMDVIAVRETSPDIGD